MVNILYLYIIGIFLDTVTHLQMCFLFVCICVVFEEPEDPSSRSFFTEIVASISDVKFSRNGRYVLSRDYLTGIKCLCGTKCVHGVCAEVGISN